MTEAIKHDVRLEALLKDIESQDPLFSVNVPAQVIEINDDDDVLKFLDRVYSREEFQYTKPAVIMQHWTAGDRVICNGFRNDVVILKKGEECVITNVKYDPKNCHQVFVKRSGIDVCISADQVTVIGVPGWFRTKRYENEYRGNETTLKAGQVIRYEGEPVCHPDTHRVAKGTKGIIAGIMCGTHAFVAWEAGKDVNCPVYKSNCGNHPNTWYPQYWFEPSHITLIRKNPVNFKELYDKHYAR